MRLGKPPGPKPQFSEADAVQAALNIGIAEFSMHKVARSLGVSTPALYRVAKSREELAHLCLAHIVRVTTLPTEFQGTPASQGIPAHTWQEQLRVLGNWAWELYELWPGLDLAMLTLPGSHAHMQSTLQMIRAQLKAVGFPGDNALIDFTVDFLLDTVTVTHIGVTAMRATAVHDAGLAQVQASLEKHAAPGHVVLPVEPSWLERGYLDGKTEFIIAALEQGISPLGAASFQGLS